MEIDSPVVEAQQHSVSSGVVEQLQEPNVAQDQQLMQTVDAPDVLGPQIDLQSELLQSQQDVAVAHGEKDHVCGPECQHTNDQARAKIEAIKQRNQESQKAAAKEAAAATKPEVTQQVEAHQVTGEGDEGVQKQRNVVQERSSTVGVELMNQVIREGEYRRAVDEIAKDVAQTSEILQTRESDKVSNHDDKVQKEMTDNEQVLGILPNEDIYDEHEILDEGSALSGQKAAALQGEATSVHQDQPVEAVNQYILDTKYHDPVSLEQAEDIDPDAIQLQEFDVTNEVIDQSGDTVTVELEVDTVVDGVVFDREAELTWERKTKKELPIIDYQYVNSEFDRIVDELEKQPGIQDLRVEKNVVDDEGGIENVQVLSGDDEGLVPNWDVASISDNELESVLEFLLTEASLIDGAAYTENDGLKKLDQEIEARGMN